MKKLLFTLLTAACFAGAASAVTDSWTSGTISGTQSSSFSIGMVINIADVDAFISSDAYSTLVSVAFSTTAGQGPSFYAYTDGGIAGKSDTIGSYGGSYYSKDKSDTTFTASDFFKAGDNSVALTVDMDGSYNTTYTLYINGKKAFTGTHSSIGTSVYSYSDIVTYSGATETYYMTGVATTADIASLPEPTALALLALGAAGLALRRKMA